MEYAEVKEFLDECVRDFRTATRKHCLTNQICLRIATECDILVHDGMEMLADIMGLEIQEEKTTVSDVWKYKYTFVYDGIKFVDYTKERMARFAEAEKGVIFK